MTTAVHVSTPLIALALISDLAFGDPRSEWHPIRLIGNLIQRGEAALWTGESTRDLRNGAVLSLGVVMLCFLAVSVLFTAAVRESAALADLLAVALGWLTLAMRGLDDAAGSVTAALGAGDLRAARLRIRALVGRDPESLDEQRLIEAAIESVAENSSDAIVAPLFYLFVAGPAGALAYKAINTLDSMIGYRDQRYLHFGRFAARLDDVANYIPARLTALCLAAAAGLAGYRGAQALEVVQADARRHHSLNAGFPEAAMAGALGIQLGGDAFYGGELEHRPRLGTFEHEATLHDLAAARTIMRYATAIAFVIMAVTRWAL